MKGLILGCLLLYKPPLTEQRFPEPEKRFAHCGRIVAFGDYALEFALGQIPIPVRER